MFIKLVDSDLDICVVVQLRDNHSRVCVVACCSALNGMCIVLYIVLQDVYQQQGTFYAPDSGVMNGWMLSHGKGGVETQARCTQHKSCQKAGRSCMHHAPRNTVRPHSNSAQHNHARQQMTRIN